jgi:hypothetical protein
MSPLLAVAAVVAAAGAIAALAGAARLGLVGLAASIIAAALIADPLPAPAVLAVRLLGAMLAVALVRAAAPAPGLRGIAMGGADGSRLGWPTELLLGLAGGLAGLAIASGLATFAVVGGSAPVAAAAIGPLTLSEATLSVAVAGVMAAVALGPTLSGAPGARRVASGVLLAEAAILLRLGFGGRPGVLEEVALALLLVTVAGAGSLLVSLARPVADGAPADGRADQRPSQP